MLDRIKEIWEIFHERYIKPWPVVDDDYLLEHQQFKCMACQYEMPGKRLLLIEDHAVCPRCKSSNWCCLVTRPWEVGPALKRHGPKTDA